jgi:hypothetical protein
LITCLLLVITVACSNVSKTSEQAPASTNTTTEAPKVGEAQDINKDASNETRRKQLNAEFVRVSNAMMPLARTQSVLMMISEVKCAVN